MEWIPQERRKRGRPRKTWKEGVQAAMKRRHLETDQWLNRKEWCLGSGRRRKLLQDRKDRQIVLCLWYMNAEVLYQQCQQLPSIISVKCEVSPNKIGIRNMHTKISLNGQSQIQPLCVRRSETNCLIRYTHMSSLYLGINVIIHFWKLYPVQIKVGFDFSYGMLSRSIDLNQASFYYSGLSRYFYIRRTFRQRYLTPAAAAAIICTYDFKVTFLVGYIGILFECNIHIEVLLFVSIPSHVLLKLKFFI